MLTEWKKYSNKVSKIIRKSRKNINKIWPSSKDTKN